jgi:hypothetical protein
MNRRWTLLIAALVAVPLTMGAGGFNPPEPGSRVIGPRVPATIVIEAHDNGTKVGQGAIRLSHRQQAAGAVFTASPETASFFFHNFGCDPARTEARFKYAPLVSFINEEIVAQLFADLGISIDGARVPIITNVHNAVCTLDPENADATNHLEPQNPGTLSFEAIIRLLDPAP